MLKDWVFTYKFRFQLPLKKKKKVLWSGNTKCTFLPIRSRLYVRNGCCLRCGPVPFCHHRPAPLPCLWIIQERNVTSWLRAWAARQSAWLQKPMLPTSKLCIFGKFLYLQGATIVYISSSAKNAYLMVKSLSFFGRGEAHITSLLTTPSLGLSFLSCNMGIMTVTSS